MSEFDPKDTRHGINPDEMPPLEPTAEVPFQHREDVNSESYLRDKFDSPSQTPPPEHQFPRPVETASEKKSRRGLIAGIAGLATAVVAAGGIFAANSGEKETSTPKPTPTIAAAPTNPGTPSPSVTETTPAPTTPETTLASRYPLSPELKQLEAATTPDKLASMTPEQRDEAFTINLKDIDENNIHKSYMDRWVVLENALKQSGMTNQDYTEFSNEQEVNDTYENSVMGKYFEPLSTKLYGPTSAKADTGGDAKEEYRTLHTLYETQHFAFRDGVTKNDFVLVYEQVPDTARILKDGDGLGMPFSVSAKVRTHNLHDNEIALNNDSGVSENNKPIDVYNNYIINEVVADADGDLTPKSVYIQRNVG